MDISEQSTAQEKTAKEIRRACRHFAMLYFNFCKTLVSVLGTEEALHQAQKTIFNLALERTDLNRRKAIQAGADLGQQLNMEEMLNLFNESNDLPTIAWSAWTKEWGGMRCPYAEQWVTYYDEHPWFKPFASLYCDVIDTTNIECFSQCLSHRITKNLLWGDASCEREYFPDVKVTEGHFTYGEREAKK